MSFACLVLLAAAPPAAAEAAVAEAAVAEAGPDGSAVPVLRFALASEFDGNSFDAASARRITDDLAAFNAARTAPAERVQFLLVAGDVVEAGGEPAHWEKLNCFLKTSPVPWELVPGNHDHSNFKAPDGTWRLSLHAYEAATGHAPARTFDRGPVRFVTAAATSPDDAVWPYLKAELAAADADPAVEHVFVVRHSYLFHRSDVWGKGLGALRGAKPFVWLSGEQGKASGLTGFTPADSPVDAAGVNAVEVLASHGEEDAYSLVSVFPGRVEFHERHVDGTPRWGKSLTVRLDRAAGAVSLHEAGESREADGPTAD